MSSSVKKIFTVLIVMVACVMIGALVLNILLPNVATTVVDALEGMVHNATGMTFDWNGNGTTGDSGGTTYTDNVNTDDTTTAAGGGQQTVEGLG